MDEDHVRTNKNGVLLSSLACYYFWFYIVEVLRTSNELLNNYQEASNRCLLLASELNAATLRQRRETTVSNMVLTVED